jgi:hypothetical protein
VSKVDDVNDINKSTDTTDGSLRRRDFLTKAAAAGTIAWAAPVILSRPAYAADAGGTPNCRPTFNFTCDTIDCGQGGKTFAGFNVNVLNNGFCPCGSPARRPITCIRITNLAGCGANDITAYGSGTICSPPNQHPTVPDRVLSTGNWECFDASDPVFFGHIRSGNGNGSISNIGNGCTITFRLGVWIGNCPDRDSTDDAFVCQTYDVTMMLSSQDTITCTFTPVAGNPLCTTVGETSPCCTPAHPECC